MKYHEIVSILPRSLSRLFYGIPKWVEARMVEPDSVALMIYNAERAGKKKEWLERFYYHKETLSVIMLIYFSNKYFINSHKMIQETLSILKELGVEEYQIGSTRFFEGSEIVEFIKEFSAKLKVLFQEDELISDFMSRFTASEIVRDYRSSYADEDLQL